MKNGSIPLVDLSRQYKGLKKEIDNAVVKILAQGNFILGQELEEFEQEFAQYCSVKHCIGVASGTDALHLSLRALDIGPGDEVITVPNTYIATVFPIVAVGATPVLVDIHPDTYQIDPDRIEKAITKKTKVIIPVHLFGIPAAMDRIMSIARRHKLYVIEDACQAHGSSFNGKKCGTFGHLGAFSFYPGKNLGAAGDGGAVVTDKKQLARKIRALRNIGQFEKHKHDLLGHNSRLDTLQAVILSAKLKMLDSWNDERRSLAKLYDSLLTDLPLVLPPGLNGDYTQNYHLYVIRVKQRDKLLEFLKANGIFAGIHYPIPVHLQKSLKHLKYKRGHFPVTEAYAKEIISLPIFPGLTEKEVGEVSKAIHEFFSKK